MSLDETRTYYYLLEQEIDRSESTHLIDALEDEHFPVREILGVDALNEQILSGKLTFSSSTQERYLWFRESVNCLSVYLSSYVRGIEVTNTLNAKGERVGTKVLEYLGRRGEDLVVPLEHTIDENGVVYPGVANVAYLEANWDALPRWAQDGYRLSFPQLRKL